MRDVESALTFHIWVVLALDMEQTVGDFTPAGLCRPFLNTDLGDITCPEVGATRR